MNIEQAENHEAAFRLSEENSFVRIRAPLIVLAVPPGHLVEHVIRAILLWPPAMAEILLEPRPFIWASPLNAFQILRLLELGADLYYSNERDNYIPWGHHCVDSFPPGTMLMRDGRKLFVDRRKAENLLDHITLCLPPVTIETSCVDRHFEIPLRLLPARPATPDLLLFHESDYERLCRILGLHHPLCRLDPEYKILWALSYLHVTGEEGRHILLFTEKGIPPPMCQALSAVARCSYCRHYEGIVFVETGRMLSPELTPHMMRDLFDLTSIHLLSGNDSRCHRLTIRNAALAKKGNIETLASLGLAIHAHAVNAFLGLVEDPEDKGRDTFGETQPRPREST